jgi:hypothetical protein
MGVLAREILSIAGAVRQRAVEITGNGDRGHRDGGGLLELALQLVILPLTIGETQAPTIVVNSRADTGQSLGIAAPRNWRRSRPAGSVVFVLICKSPGSIDRVWLRVFQATLTVTEPKPSADWIYAPQLDIAPPSCERLPSARQRKYPIGTGKSNSHAGGASNLASRCRDADQFIETLVVAVITLGGGAAVSLWLAQLIPFLTPVVRICRPSSASPCSCPQSGEDSWPDPGGNAHANVFDIDLWISALE